jgi:hypothetical protein
MTKGFRIFYAAALAGGLLLSGAGGTKLMAGENHHGNLGSPNRSGKFIAPLRNQVKKIKTEIREDQTQIDRMKNDLEAMNSDIDSLTAHVEALETAALQPNLFQPNLLWINHFGLVVDPTYRLATSFAGHPLGGSSGLLIRAVFPVVDQTLATGLQVPPGYNVRKVRLCYQLSSPASFITHIKIAQLTTANAAIDVLTDLADQTSMSPVCVDSMPAAAPISTANGPLRLDLGVTFGDPEDLIVIRAVGLYLEPAI